MIYPSEGAEADFAGSRCIIHRRGSTDVQHFCHLWGFPQVKPGRSEVWTCLCQLHKTLLSLLAHQGQQGLTTLRCSGCAVTCKKTVILQFIVKIRMGEFSPSLFILSSYLFTNSSLNISTYFDGGVGALWFVSSSSPSPELQLLLWESVQLC